ncbi:odorant receptor 131-2-like [Hyperolius riggenbachi]|uniref:odorant receptor 131-2-like n=1 Tax=Hyperolius riggenbachi TaxID=752182 RepID=UPI0035A2FE95
METANASIFYSNLTTETIITSKTLEVIVISLLLLMMVGACIFFCLAVTMLYIIFSSLDVHHNPRYILFAFMLISDSLYLMLCFTMYILAMRSQTILMPLCCAIYTVSSATFIATQYHLAAMSLECYIAICFPLRHCVICTPRRAMLVVVTIWVWSTIPYAVELVVINVTLKDPSNMQVICFTSRLLVNSVQPVIRLLSFILCFTFVGLSILFSYIKIMSVALSKNSKTSSASKAGKTVLIHGVQLFLCICSLLSNFTEIGLGKYFQVLTICSFIIFNYVPRFLSPLIYGVRDADLRRHIRKHLSLPQKIGFLMDNHVLHR